MLRKWMFWARESLTQVVERQRGSAWGRVVNAWSYFWSSKHRLLHSPAQGFGFPLSSLPPPVSFGHPEVTLPLLHIQRTYFAHISSLSCNAVGVCLCPHMCECNTLCKKFTATVESCFLMWKATLWEGFACSRWDGMSASGVLLLIPFSLCEP